MALLMLGRNVHSSACDHSANTCMAGERYCTNVGKSRSLLLQHDASTSSHP